MYDAEQEFSRLFHEAFWEVWGPTLEGWRREHDWYVWNCYAILIEERLSLVLARERNRRFIDIQSC